jgi:NDP-sugar pyrophosphorylase family protein
VQTRELQFTVYDGGLVESSVLMSGVSVGRGARIRHAVIEEGVHVPAGFQIGFDLENDRKLYFVTDNGVIVVSRTPKQIRPAVLRVTGGSVPGPAQRPDLEPFSSKATDHG